MVVTDAAGQDVVSYLVPMTYRAAALGGADGALIGTSEHGVLGRRFLYDGPADQVLRTQLSELVRGNAQPQAQTRSGSPDPTVLVGAVPDATHVDLVRALSTSEAAPGPGEVSVPWRLPDGSQVRGVVLRASPPGGISRQTV
jgi:hypothetical protein